MSAPTRISNKPFTSPTNPGLARAGVQLYPDPSTAAQPLWQRVEQAPTITIERHEVNAIHTLIRKGIDPIHFGYTRLRIDRTTGEEIVQKAAWACTSNTYNRRMVLRGKRQRTYTRQLHHAHLTGAADDFFCGAAPSTSESGWQWALLDLDNRGDGFDQLANHVKAVFPELHFQPSTSSKGLHAVIRISHFNRWHPLEDREMHNLIISWSGRLKRATGYISAATEGGFCELKGACCYWNPPSESWTLGTLGRLPRLSSEQLRSIPLFKQADFEQRLISLETAAGISPAVVVLSSSPQGDTTAQPPAKDNNDWWDEDAFKRMVHAKCLYVKQHKRLPETAELLCDYYEQLRLNTGDRTSERLQRAESILAYSREKWRPGGGTEVVCNPQALRERQKVVSEYISATDIKAAQGKKSRVTVTTLEIAAYQLIAIELNEADGFSSRKKIMSVMNEWHEEKHLPHIISKEKMAMLRRISLNHALLVLTITPSVAAKRASSYREAKPAPASSAVVVLSSSPQGQTNNTRGKGAQEDDPHVVVLSSSPQGQTNNTRGKGAQEDDPHVITSELALESYYQRREWEYELAAAYEGWEPQELETSEQELV